MTKVHYTLASSNDKRLLLQFRITPYEANRIQYLKDEFDISDREIFEILCHGECGGAVITGIIKRGRDGCQTKKVVQIPRNILTKKKT